MVFLERAVMIWIAGWLISSICFIAAKKVKAKETGETFHVKEGLNGVAGLIIGWPVAAIMYVVISFNKKNKC